VLLLCIAQVFMVSDQALLDEGLVRAMLHSGHSRVPVYRGNDPSDFAGLILVKEVLQFWRCPETPRVSQLSLRPFPRLPADTPMFDMLRFFQVGPTVLHFCTVLYGTALHCTVHCHAVHNNSVPTSKDAMQDNCRQLSVDKAGAFCYVA
jgi:Mg2+/Co2+ transporter CorC